MSLQAFQQALVELTLLPIQTRRLVQGNLGLLDKYELDELERRRVLDIVQQRGMSVNCSIARGNRFDAIAEVFPMTCVLLEPVLSDLLSELWSDVLPVNYQFTGEEDAFARIVRQGLSADRFSSPYLKEIFEYECICWELAQRMRNQTDSDLEVEGFLEFKHPPDLLLEPLSNMIAPPPNLPTGVFRARLILRGTRFHVEMISSDR